MRHVAWIAIRIIGGIWNATFLIVIAGQLLDAGNVHINAAGASNLSAAETIAWLAGFGCSLICALYHPEPR